VDTAQFISYNDYAMSFTEEPWLDSLQNQEIFSSTKYTDCLWDPPNLLISGTRQIFRGGEADRA
jgi:hypothetical protein